MPFTPDNSNNFIIQSREYGDGSEFNDGSSSIATLDIIPNHYVMRLWRKAAVPTPNGSRKIVYINKSPNSSDRSVAFSTIDAGNAFAVKRGDGGMDLLTVEWEGSGLKAMERSRQVQTDITIFYMTGNAHESLQRHYGKPNDQRPQLHEKDTSSQSRTFQGPDGLEYKWKVIYCGSNPAYPDYWYLELHVKDSKVPIATSARLSNRDGFAQEEAHPVYIAERGIRMIPWVIATFALAERLLAAS